MSQPIVPQGLKRVSKPRLYEQLVEQLPPEAAEKLPPLPPHGDLDLSLVLESRYFFA